MEKIDYTSWNVVALFNKELTEELIGLSHLIAAKIPSKILLNGTDTYPHMTIYTTNYPTKNFTKIKEKLSIITKKFRSFPIRFSQTVIDMNTIFINADPNQKLQHLHDEVVDSLNLLRNGLYDEKELQLIGNNEARKKSLLMYGMWAAKELYVPHISISRPFDASKCKQAFDLLPKKKHFLMKIENIALVERGHDGTCKRIIKVYLLGG